MFVAALQAAPPDFPGGDLFSASIDVGDPWQRSGEAVDQASCWSGGLCWHRAVRVRGIAPRLLCRWLQSFPFSTDCLESTAATTNRAPIFQMETKAERTKRQGLFVALEPQALSPISAPLG